MSSAPAVPALSLPPHDLAGGGKKKKRAAGGKRKGSAAAAKKADKPRRKHSAVGKTIAQGEKGALYYKAGGKRHYIQVR